VYSWGEGLDAISCSVEFALRWEGERVRCPKVLFALRQEADGNRRVSRTRNRPKGSPGALRRREAARRQTTRKLV
jgi:hypothetical protein